jgi:hypothetical protein
VLGRRKRDGSHSPPKNNLKQDSERNEENEYPFPDSNNKKMINNAKEPNDVQTPSKKKNLQAVTENFMEMLLDMVKQNV